MRLSDLLTEIEHSVVSGSIEIDITGIAYDSRKVSVGDLFICKGVTGDGHIYADDAYANGARAFLIEKGLSAYHADAAYVHTKDTKAALSLLSRSFFGFPDRSIYTLGITGTKGKTTTTYMFRKILASLGISCGIIGTIYNIVGEEKYEAERTTPEGYDIQKMLRCMVDAGNKAVAIEVSSHALSLDRIRGMVFDTGIFTNLSQDHLDFHSDMDDYFSAKQKLFDHTRRSIVNIDDAYGSKLFRSLKQKGREVYSVSFEDPRSDFFGTGISYDGRYMKFHISGYEDLCFSCGMYGKYNAYNALCAISAAHIYGMDFCRMTDSLADISVPGRQEKYPNKNGNFIIIDYAHSPDSIKETLEIYRKLCRGRLSILFGAGGDRDKKKRPLMGKIAGELADYVIITSDNPRTEPPEMIIKDIVVGINEVKNADYTVITDRREAIRHAVLNARENDILILAGKGHETYQEINNVKYHMDEREILDEIYKEIK